MFKKFGFWKEMGEDFSAYPSIFDYVNSQKNKLYDKAKLSKYFAQSGIIVSTSRNNFPHIFTGKIEYGSINIKTDGEWEWLDILEDYILEYEVCIPDDWYNLILHRQFEIPMSVKESLDEVDWPLGSSMYKTD